MIDLQTALIQFFQQFTDRAYIEGFAVERDTTGNAIPPPFPYITFSYASSDIFTNTLATFQIWTRSSNFLEALAIAKKIEESIPVLGGTMLEIAGGVIYEFFNPGTNQWQEFDLKDFEDIFRSFLPHVIEWREKPGKSRGALRLYRGSPFIQPRSTDDQTLVVYYGNIEIRSHLI